MKKATATLFFIVYLFSTTESNQLLKIPVVFQHFAEHKQENKHITFIGFLALHYLHGSPKDKDYERDMQLPFKTTVNCISAIATTQPPITLEFSFVKAMETPEKKSYINKDQFILSSYLSRIWQPPRLC